MYALKHFDYERPILITFLMMVIAVGLLAVNISAAIFVFMSMFNFLWIFIDVYQMGGVLSQTDRVALPLSSLAHKD